MEKRDTARLVKARQRELLAGVSAMVPEMQGDACALDREAAFPSAAFARLRALGALAAPVPAMLGGLGMGTEPAGAAAVAAILRLLGRGNLSVGRIFEAHVNALRLIFRYGTHEQAQRAAADALAGHLFGLWVTDTPDHPVRLGDDMRLAGAKAPCSAAGFATRAVITACNGAAAARLLVIGLAPETRVARLGWASHGMRAAANGRVELDGLQVGQDAIIGAPGDYLRQPDFSAGAWRGSAVTLGGLEALAESFRAQLVARRRAGDAHQLARVGEVLIAQETARMWVARAARVAEANDGDAGDVANLANLARIAVETATLDAIRIVQRGLGMAAFRQGALVELLFRDLAMYLRQPAPDETLGEAAAHFMRRDVPSCDESDAAVSRDTA